jgi:hypothetical protein
MKPSEIAIIVVILAQAIVEVEGNLPLCREGH